MSAVSPPNADRLLRQCREVLEHDLAEWMEELGPIIAEELFSLANETRDSVRQGEYLQLRQELQDHWKSLTAAFQKGLADAGRRENQAEAPSGGPLDYANLQLVDDDELTERIVIREFTARVSEACSEEVYGLERRLAYLLGKEELTDGDDQLGPMVVCTAVHAACEALRVSLDSRTLLLRRIERHLQAELPELYRAINEVLIEAGVLPALKRTYRRAVPAGTLSAADGANILSTLQRLAQARQLGASGGVPGGAGMGIAAAGGGFPGGVMAGGGALPPGAVAVSAAFLDSLQAFQSLPAVEAGSLTNVVRLVRETDAARQVPPLEAITLDIVATLFDLIFDDGKVPTAVKGLVSRLQIPVLKVAMQDRSFFSDRGHPARRFLDSISGIAVRWGATVNEGDPFYAKLSELVERIQDNFDKDANVFAAAITEISTFVTEREAMEADTTSLVAEVAQRQEEVLQAQRERQSAARQAAEDALAPLLAAEMPRPIEQFLRGQWRAVLYDAALAEGGEGERFRAAEGVGKDLVWSVVPKTTPEERSRLVSLLVRLLPALNQGLDRIGISAEARRPLLDALMALHSAAIRADVEGQRAVPELVEPAPPAAPEIVELQVTRSVESGISIEQVSLPEAEVAAEGGQDRSFQRRIKHLVRGDWIDFIDEKGDSRRERLTWLSPNRTIYIFSNHATKCAISITPEALAHRLQTGTARLVENEAPMFERALDGAIKALDTPAAGGGAG